LVGKWKGEKPLLIAGRPVWRFFSWNVERLDYFYSWKRWRWKGTKKRCDIALGSKNN
jgi:hypothetical protein